MKNSPIIKVKNSAGEQENINANHVVRFKAQGSQQVYVVLQNGETLYFDCTERSFRSYMNKALGVSKKDDDEA